MQKQSSGAAAQRRPSSIHDTYRIQCRSNLLELLLREDSCIDDRIYRYVLKISSLDAKLLTLDIL